LYPFAPRPSLVNFTLAVVALSLVAANDNGDARPETGSAISTDANYTDVSTTGAPTATLERCTSSFNTFPLPKAQP